MMQIYPNINTSKINKKGELIVPERVTDKFMDEFMNKFMDNINIFVDMCMDMKNDISIQKLCKLD